MKISEILSEAAVEPYKKTPITDDIMDALKTHCSEALASMGSSPLWRGSLGTKDNVLTMDPTAGTRKSQNTSNYYTMLMDNSPYMRGWPKRSKSLICSTSYSTARAYGSETGTYAIYPFNGTKLAVCPKQDLWGTRVDFPGISSREISWDDINRYLISLGFEDDKSFEAIVAHTKTERFAQKLENQQEQNHISDPITPEQFIPLLLKNMAPDKVGFTLHDVSSFNPEKYQSREIWFSAPCIAIKYGIWINLPINR